MLSRIIAGDTLVVDHPDKAKQPGRLYMTYVKINDHNHYQQLYNLLEKHYFADGWIGRLNEEFNEFYEVHPNEPGEDYDRDFDDFYAVLDTTQTGEQHSKMIDILRSNGFEILGVSH